MVRPGAVEIRQWSKLDFGEYGFSEFSEFDPGDPLQRVVDAAADYVTFVTAREMNADTPTLIVSVIQEAVRMRTEQIVMQQQQDTVETAGDIDLISSLSVGGYRSPAAIRSAVASRRR